MKLLEKILKKTYAKKRQREEEWMKNIRARIEAIHNSRPRNDYKITFSETDPFIDKQGEEK